MFKLSVFFATNKTVFDMPNLIFSTMQFGLQEIAGVWLKADGLTIPKKVSLIGLHASLGFVSGKSF